jgi:hypothetical protein
MNFLLTKQFLIKQKEVFMDNNDKLRNQQNSTEQREDNMQMDQDHGNMNNGTIGGNMGVIGNSDEDKAGESKASEQAPGAAANEGKSDMEQ